jgi:enoyl-CoA hydratase
MQERGQVMEFFYETLLVEHHGSHVLSVTLNRPEAANAFNTQMARDLIDLFEALALSDCNIRAIVLTGSGQRAFCAGGDLKERNGMTDTAWQAQHLVYERMVRAVIGCPIPIIGAINGAAYGGGCELVAAVDFAYVSETAKFAQTEVTLGIIPGAGGTQTLARAVGERRAKELILTGRVFSAHDAYNWGLANEICTPETLMARALDTAYRIAANAPIAVRQAKQSIHKGLQMGLMDGLAFEIEAYNRTVPTEDRKEGVTAFNEKRPPNFKGK